LIPGNQPKPNRLMSPCGNFQIFVGHSFSRAVKSAK
jgi:hypothetical protein